MMKTSVKLRSSGTLILIYCKVSMDFWETMPIFYPNSISKVSLRNDCSFRLHFSWHFISMSNVFPSFKLEDGTSQMPRNSFAYYVHNLL